jgi:DNA-binding NtrC family response regulator
MIAPAVSGKGVNRGTVLVVDDEPSIIKAASRLLRSMGFEVLVTMVAQEAVEICRAYGEEIDAVLLDLFLQGASSMETLRQMCSLRPGIKVILMSGYSKLESADYLGGVRIDGFLTKPFGYADLENAIRAVLALPPVAAQ